MVPKVVGSIPIARPKLLMTEKLEQYTFDKLQPLAELYSDNVLYARKVGDIDWPHPFPESLLVSYIHHGELFGLNDDPDTIQSSVRLYEGGANSTVLHVGKLTTSEAIRGTRFVERRLLPAIIDEATIREKTELHLTCLAHNTRLASFYRNLGFNSVDVRPALADNGESVIVREMTLPIA